jgi:hypothetical protein
MRASYSITLLTVGAFAVAFAYALSFGSESSVAPWLLAAGATLVLTGLGLLGAGPRAPRLAAAVLVACACTFAGFAVGLLHEPPASGGPLLFGLPRSTSLLLLFTGLVPLVLLPVAYGLFFERDVMADAD